MHGTAWSVDYRNGAVNQKTKREKQSPVCKLQVWSSCYDIATPVLVCQCQWYGGRLHLQFDDVWMSEEFEILDLSSDLPDDIECLDLLPIKYLDGDLVTSQLVYANCSGQITVH